MRRCLAPLVALAFCLAASASHAQTIYPITRAEILAGAKFDFKVEFPGAVAAPDIKVTVNGRDAAQAFGKAATVEPNEEGQGHTAYWIRDVTLEQPGAYEVSAAAGDKSQTATWEVFGTPARRARNVILFIGDGLSVAHRTAARVLSKGLVEGRYGGELAIDDMPHMALVSTSGMDCLVTDSANSMSAYTTGHKSCVNAMGAYCAHNKNGLAHPKVETIAELVKRRNGGMGVGVVTNTEIEDATPAGMVAHVRRRSDYDDIVRMFYELKPDVMMGGGTGFFLPKADTAGKRKDEENYLEKFKAAGYRSRHGNGDEGAPPTEHDAGCSACSIRATSTVRSTARAQEGHRAEVSRSARSRRPDAGGDRHPVAQAGRVRADGGVRPDRQVQPRARLGARRVRHHHARQRCGAPPRASPQRDDTLIIVVADHAHPVSIIGTINDDMTKTSVAPLRERVGTYNKAEFPNYPAPDKEGYPPRVDASRRLAIFSAASPDYCETFRPKLDGPNAPTVEGQDKGTYDANEHYCNMPGAMRRLGNLPKYLNQSVHSGEDVILTATGPGSERVRGQWTTLKCSA